MYVSSAQTLEMVTRVLEERVMPAIEERGARGQLWAAIGLLDNLAATGESPHRARELLELCRLVAAAPAELATVTDRGEPAETDKEAITVTAGEDLEDLLASESERLVAMLAAAARLDPRPLAVAAWLDRCGAALDELNGELVSAMRSTRYGRAVRGD